MSFAEPTEAQPESPLPHEPDVGLCVLITVPNTHELKFVACMPAAIRFAVHWVIDYPAVSVTFEAPDPHRRRLPCERLWALP
ncbi:hypothetical protein [Nocardia aobensis]|uniref:hypothetical protein n=1 Tax=Nocardia aobensis TaxID=257277 RepID=UPI000301E6EE|nr:hypothetical protein [Nocardia aobensis]